MHAKAALCLSYLHNTLMVQEDVLDGNTGKRQLRRSQYELPAAHEGQQQRNLHAGHPAKSAAWQIPTGGTACVSLTSAGRATKLASSVMGPCSRHRATRIVSRVMPVLTPAKQLVCQLSDVSGDKQATD